MARVDIVIQPLSFSRVGNERLFFRILLALGSDHNRAPASVSWSPHFILRTSHFFSLLQPFILDNLSFACTTVCAFLARACARRFKNSDTPREYLYSLMRRGSSLSVNYDALGSNATFKMHFSRSFIVRRWISLAAMPTILSFSLSQIYLSNFFFFLFS